MDANQLKKLKELESELVQYKKMYAELAHQNYVLKDVIENRTFREEVLDNHNVSNTLVILRLYRMLDHRASHSLFQCFLRKAFHYELMSTLFLSSIPAVHW